MIKCKCPEWDQEHNLAPYNDICVACGKPIIQKEVNMIEYTMPHWSVHHGQDISDVPRDYLEFLLEQDWIDSHPALVEAIEDNLSIRDRSHITF